MLSPLPARLCRLLPQGRKNDWRNEGAARGEPNVFELSRVATEEDRRSKVWGVVRSPFLTTKEGVGVVGENLLTKENEVVGSPAEFTLQSRDCRLILRV